MGTKLTKTKSVLISERNNEERKTITTTAESADTRLDAVTTNPGNKHIVKKIKTKKEAKLNEKSSKIKMDKSTNTENCVLLSSPFSEQLVADKISPENKNILLSTSTAQVNAAYQFETQNKDVKQLWNTLADNGIITGDFHVGNQQSSCEQDYHALVLNNAEQVTHSGPATVAHNGNEIHDAKQPQ